MASRKKLNYQISKNETGKVCTLTVPRQEIQIDLSGKSNNQKTVNINCRRQIQQMAKC